MLKSVKKTNLPLQWNVCINDFFGGGNGISFYNVFDGHGFWDDLLKFKRGYLKALKAYTAEIHTNEEIDKWILNYRNTIFNEEVRRSLLYYYWSKCEWEVVITSWPPYVKKEEIDRLNKEMMDNPNHYRESVNLDVGEKIDVYSQVMANWDIFIDYVWNNLDKIKKD